MKNESDADRVYKEVKKRKQRAEELGITDLIERLYFYKLMYYPHWLKNDRESICSLVTDAAELEDETKEGTITKTTIIINNMEYAFSFKECDFSSPDGKYAYADLELAANGKRVLALALSSECSEYGFNWKTFDVEAFIEGDWIEEFRQLKKVMEMEEKERERKQKESPEKIKQLKEDFGID